MMDPIQKYLIKNELTLKRYRRFKRDRIAVLSVWVLPVMFFFSFTAELWANSVPQRFEISWSIVLFHYSKTTIRHSSIAMIFS